MLWIIFYSYTIDTLSPNSDHCPLTFILDVPGIRRSQRISNSKDNPITRYCISAENNNNFEASLWTSEWVVNMDLLYSKCTNQDWNFAGKDLSIFIVNNGMNSGFMKQCSNKRK